MNPMAPGATRTTMELPRKAALAGRGSSPANGTAAFPFSYPPERFLTTGCRRVNIPLIIQLTWVR